MKFTSQISAGLVSMSLLVAASAADAVKFNVPTAATAQPAAPATPAPAAAPAAPAKPKFTEAQLAEAYGWYMGAQMGLHELEFTREQVEAMARGMLGAASGAQPQFDPKEVGPELDAFMRQKNESFMTKLRYQQLADGKEFFTKLKENKNVIDLPSGLRYEVLKAGTGAMPKAGQVVTMHYIGALVNGKVFDNSVERGEPAEMQLADGRVIPGMVEGLQKIAVGGKIKLYIPPSLAYGDAGNQAIPPGATLVFEIELLGIKDAPKEAPAPVPVPAVPAGK